MKTNWDLTVFYKDFDDPAFKADLGGLDASIAALTEAVAAPCEDEAAKLTALVGQVEALGMTFERLMLMVELTLSVDAQNKPANAAMAPLMRSAMLMEQANNALGRYLSKLENLIRTKRSPPVPSRCGIWPKTPSISFRKPSKSR